MTPIRFGFEPRGGAGGFKITVGFSSVEGKIALLRVVE
jgi:hypothetical protein